MYEKSCIPIYLYVLQVESEGLEPVEWEGDPGFVRFTRRKAWEKWKESKQEVLTSDIQDWIRLNL